MKKIKWQWIKFWGYRYKMVSPFSLPKYYIIYHRKIYDAELWDGYFKNIEKEKKLWFYTMKKSKNLMVF